MAKVEKLLKKLKDPNAEPGYICPVCQSKGFDGSDCGDCGFDAFCMF